MTEPSAPTDPRVVDSRQRIRRAVRDLVTERGLRHTKIKDILERACVARATFYAHFQDKEDAFCGDIPPLRIAVPEGTPQDGPTPVPPLTHLFHHVREMRPLFASMRQRGEQELPLRAAQPLLFDTYRRAFAEIDRRGYRLGGPVHELACAAAGAVLALLQAWMEPDATGSAEERAKLAEDLVRRIATGPPLQ
ncbi:MAG: TetR/AcrR family transcriptional regulator [Planctomycetota bacterium]